MVTMRDCPKCGKVEEDDIILDNGMCRWCLHGEIERLNHIIAVMKYHAIDGGRIAREIEGNVRVQDGRLEVWCLGDWVDVKQARAEAEEEGGEEESLA